MLIEAEHRLIKTARTKIIKDFARYKRTKVTVTTSFIAKVSAKNRLFVKRLATREYIPASSLKQEKKKVQPHNENRFPKMLR